MVKKQYYRIVKELALTDFKLRYSSSILGYIWSFLHPLIFFAVLYFVFKVLFRFQQESYALYLFLGILLWTYLAECTTRGMTSVKDKGGLIKKIIFPRQFVVYAANMTTSISLLINIGIFLIFFFIAGGTVSWTWIFFPIYLAELIVLSLGIGLILASYFLKFRDLGHIWDVCLQLWFWLTPIWYPISQIPEKYRILMLSINPMARLVTDARNALIYHAVPTLRHQIINIAMVGIVLLIGYYVFKKRSKYFVDEL